MQSNNNSEYFKIVDEILDAIFLCKIDEGIFYSKNHLCFKEIEKNIFLVGFDTIITRFLSFVSTFIFTSNYERINEGLPFGWLVQDGKTLSIPSPVNAILVEHNKNVINVPEIVRTKKFPDNWFVKFQIVDDKSKDKLLFGVNAYEWYVKKIDNLKTTLRNIINESTQTSLVTQYDGGRITYSISEILPKKENLKILMDLLGGK